MSFFTRIWFLPRNLLIASIRVYQKTLSPDHGWFKGLFPEGFCKYEPSCSEYGVLALEKYGAVRGTLKTLWRILRCNPWSKGGEDLP